MSEKGEATLFGVFTLVALTGIMLLCSLELSRSYRFLTRRSELFLCTKEAKGELNSYLKLMGRSNWAINNIQRAKLVMLFIPGLQGVALNSEKAKTFLKAYQNAQLFVYLNRIKKIAAKGCATDPRLFLTPYMLNGAGYLRQSSGAAIIRKQKWTYIYSRSPYALALEVNTSQSEKVNPKITYRVRESGGRLSSPWSTAW